MLWGKNLPSILLLSQPQYTVSISKLKRTTSALDILFLFQPGRRRNEWKNPSSSFVRTLTKLSLHLISHNLCGCVCVWVREREIETDRQTETEGGKKGLVKCIVILYCPAQLLKWYTFIQILYFHYVLLVMFYSSLPSEWFLFFFFFGLHDFFSKLHFSLHSIKISILLVVTINIQMNI